MNQLVAAFSLALLLTACGGGGGSAGGETGTGTGTGNGGGSGGSIPAIANGFDVWEVDVTPTGAAPAKLCMQLASGSSAGAIDPSPLFVAGYGEAADLTGSVNASGALTLSAPSFGSTQFSGTVNAAATSASGSYTGSSTIGAGSFTAQRIAGKHSCFWDTIDNQAVLDADVANDAEAPVIQVDASGRPVVAFTEWVNGTPVGGVTPFEQQVFVKRWNGSQWTLLGGKLNSGNNDTAGRVRLALDASGNPVVAWTERNKTSLADEAHVKRWTGTAWQDLGGALNSLIVTAFDADAYTGGIVVDGSGAPVLALAALVAPSQFNTELRRWNGSAWLRLGSALLSAYPYDLVVDPADGQPGVLWKDPVGSLYVAKWTGSTMGGFGGIASIYGPGVPSAASLAFRAGSVPVVAYQYQPGFGETVAVVTYTGGSWGTLIPGVPIEPGGTSTAPRVLVDRADNAVVVATAATTSGGLTVKKALTSQWKRMGSAIDSPTLFSADAADIAFAADGKLYATFAQRPAAGSSRDVVVYGWPLSR